MPDINASDAVIYNFTPMDKGRTLELDVYCDVYSGNTVVGQFDFSPYSGATMMVKIKSTDTYHVMKFDTEDGSIVLNDDGLLQFRKTAAEMNAINAGLYHYDMYLEANPSSKRAFLTGTLTIRQNITT